MNGTEKCFMGTLNPHLEIDIIDSLSYADLSFKILNFYAYVVASVDVKKEESGHDR